MVPMRHFVENVCDAKLNEKLTNNIIFFYVRKTHDRPAKIRGDELSRTILYLLRYGASFTILYGIVFMYEFYFSFESKPNYRM